MLLCLLLLERGINWLNCGSNLRLFLRFELFATSCTQLIGRNSATRYQVDGIIIALEFAASTSTAAEGTEIRGSVRLPSPREMEADNASTWLPS